MFNHIKVSENIASSGYSSRNFLISALYSSICIILRQNVDFPHEHIYYSQYDNDNSCDQV